MPFRPTCSIAVTDYAAHARLPRHAHAESSLGFVLRGSLVEEAGGRRHAAAAGELVIKPAGADHANEFGSDGARILSLRFDPADGPWRDPVPPAAYRWQRDPARFGAAISLALAARASALSRPDRGGPGPVDVDRSTFDLEEQALALASAALGAGVGAAAPRTAPAWLARVIERLAEDPALERLDPLAELAGVHPVHLARVFRRCTGTTMRAFRRRQRVLRAVDLLAGSGRRLAEIAQASSFSDEAHLCRSLRRELGTTPGALATLLRS